MGVETADFISELDDTAPAGTDYVAEGDNHLRLLKSVLQATFPNADKEFHFPTSADYTTNQTLTASQAGLLVRMDATGGARSVTLPAKSTLQKGDYFYINKVDDSTNEVSVIPAQGTIEGQAQLVLGHKFHMVLVIWSGTTWVSSIRNVGLWLAQRTITADITLNYADLGRLHYVGSGATEITVTLPTAVGYDGATIGFKHVGTAGTDLTLDGRAAQTIDGAATYIMSAANETVWLVATGGNWQIFNYNVAGFSPSQRNTWTAVQLFQATSLQLAEQTLVLNVGDVDWNLELGNHAKVTIDANATINNPTHKVVTQTGFLRLIGALNGATLTWGSNYAWLSDPPATIDNGDIRMLEYYVAASNVVYIWEVVNSGTEAYTDYDLGVPAKGTLYTQAHGLGALPANVNIYLKCITTDGNVAVAGDYLLAYSVWGQTDGSDDGPTLCSVRYNSTNVKVAVINAATGEFLITTDTAGVTSSVDLSKYHLVLRVFA